MDLLQNNIPSLFGIDIEGHNELKLIMNKKTQFVSTLNAEIIIKALEDRRLYDIVNNSIVTLDGQWTKFLFDRKYNKKYKSKKISGSSYIFDIVKNAKQNNFMIMLLGAEEKVNYKAVKNLKDQFQYDKICGYSPPYSDYPFNQKISNKIKQQISNHRPKFIITAFGVPKQEYWAQDNLKFLNDYGVNYVMFFGGSLDFVAGKFSRAPKVIQNYGLESVFRLFQNPSRIEREFNKLKLFKYYFKHKV